ncbi:MAG: hypothetical protein M1814_001873 [Vezdaea aestivalis]|nr:MAG: hypothetical protein M1814_001873 [Vezdaea aestivalis]
MGWLWKTTEPSSDPAPSAQSSSTLLQDPSEPSSSSTTVAPPTSSPPPTRTLSRDELAEAELNDFLSTLNRSTAEPQGKPSNHSPSLQPPLPAPSPSTSSAVSLTLPTPELEGPEETEWTTVATYPTRMRCTDLFDSAVHCASFGGQLNNVYRYGEMKACGEHWAAWRFCMRAKALGQEERERAVQKYYRDRAKSRYGGRMASSEDVWVGRKEVLVGAFREGIVDEGDGNSI